MRNGYNLFSVSFIYFLIITPFTGCNNVTYKSPEGYHLNQPEKFTLGNALNEISGITFFKNNDDSIFAIQDEDAKIYFFKPGDNNYAYSKFGKNGDYEDVTILNNNVVVLRSNGSLFLFPVDEIGKEKIENVHEYNNILPAGEYEGLCADDGSLFALCKNCQEDKDEKEVTVYTLNLFSGDSLSVTNSFKIDISKIQPDHKKERIKFHPSCIAKNPATHEWFIISSVNKLLLVLDEQWNVKAYYPLDPSLFKQPEGLTFNARGDMYISNEGGQGAANILFFRHH